MDKQESSSSSSRGGSNSGNNSNSSSNNNNSGNKNNVVTPGPSKRSNGSSSNSSVSQNNSTTPTTSSSSVAVITLSSHLPPASNAAISSISNICSINKANRITGKDFPNFPLSSNPGNVPCPKRRKIMAGSSGSGVSAEKEGQNNAVQSSSSSSSSVSTTASSGAVHSWQETKASIKERTTCLVNSERLSDIKFLVGPLEAPIFGHKTILSASSPYFEHLFYGPMSTKEPVIKIPDIEPEVFLGFLKYLYTDEFDDSMDDNDAMMLLKPAKIYIVPHLANKCARLLINKMSPDNVFLIYNHAITFDEPDLALVCLRFLDRQIDKVIQTEEFLEIDRETLCTLLERENLRINECLLFKAIMSWTEAECQRRDLDITPEHQREVLGNALYLIRFPSMTREEFSIEVPKGILSKDEIISVFMNLCISNEKKQFRPETPFFTERRVYRPKLHYLTRFSDVLSKVIHYTPHVLSGDNVYNSSCRFRTDQRVFLHGVGVYAVSSTINGLKFVASVTLFKSAEATGTPVASSTPGFGQLLGTKTLDGSTRSYDFRMPFQMMFEQPLEVRRGEDYVILATLKIARDTNSVPYGSLGLFGGTGAYGNQIDAYYGTKPLAIVNTACNDGIKVNFAFPSLPSNETFTAGQIPQLIFSV